jgi:hypothetical protein
VKWTLASSTGHGRDKDRQRGVCGHREAGGGRLADSVGARWRALAKPLRHGYVHARTGRPGGHGPSWATGKRALPFKFFSKSAQNLKLKTKVFPMSKIH